MQKIEEIKSQEEAKRERNWDAQQRWRVIQQTIAWADAQQAVPRNSKESCLQRQARLVQGGRQVIATSQGS